MNDVDRDATMRQVQAKIRRCHKLMLEMEAMDHPQAAAWLEYYEEPFNGWERARAYITAEIEALRARYDRLWADFALAKAIAAVEKREQGGAGA
jgi:hypothetical protein